MHIPTQYLPVPSPLTIIRENHNQKLMQLYARTNRYHYLFLPRTIPDWNNVVIDDLANCNLCPFKDYLSSILPLMGFANVLAINNNKCPGRWGHTHIARKQQNFQETLHLVKKY